MAKNVPAEELSTLSVADIRQGGMPELVRARKDTVHELLRLTENQLGIVSRAITPLVYPVADVLSRRWLKKTNNPYREEIEEAARIVGKPGVVANNVLYEWTCTTGAIETPAREAPQMVRVLDWLIPGMGRHAVAAHQAGPAGEFYNVTWPGLSGVLTGVAQGRFAAAINQAPMERHWAGGIAMDWLRTHADIYRSNALPPAHLLRQAFEKAASYGEAKEMLTRTPVAAPVIYILTGTRKGEGCVIERLENRAEVRELESDGRVFATNHFQTRLNGAGGGWSARGVDNYARHAAAHKIDAAEVDRGFGWFVPPIACKFSRLALTADARSGEFRVVGTEKDKIVTHELKAGGPRGIAG